MDNKRIILTVVIVTAVIAAALFGGWYYFSVSRKAPARTGLVSPVGGQLPYPSPLPFIPGEFLWNLVGTIQKIDLQNKFFEMRLGAFSLSTFAPEDFTDTYRIYFDDSLVYPHIVVETEKGVGVKFNRFADFPLSQVGPGKPVRALVKFRDDGTFFATTLYIFDFKPR